MTNASSPARAGRSPTLEAELRRMGEERFAAERETTRAIRREYLRAGLSCVGSCVAGLVVMAFGLHAMDRQTGMMFWWGGLAIGYSGMALSLARAYRRGEERGYW